MSTAEASGEVAASPRRVILLDACGVLFGEPMQPLFEAVGQDVGRSAGAVAAIFRYEFRDALWSGRLSESQFWTLFAYRCGALTVPPRWREVLLTSMRPLPAVRWLPTFLEGADIWLLSNHRHEWLEPVLAQAGVDRLLQRVLISSRTGLVKPDPALYRYVHRLAAAEVLYVDDKPGNVDAAVAAGITSVLADPDGQWVQTALGWLGIAWAAEIGVPS